MDAVIAVDGVDDGEDTSDVYDDLVFDGRGVAGTGRLFVPPRWRRKRANGWSAEMEGSERDD